MSDANGTKQVAKNGEVVIGDMEYDGRVILYIIKGLSVSPVQHHRPDPYLRPPGTAEQHR